MENATIHSVISGKPLTPEMADQLAYMRKEKNEHPIIYIGAGTCGLGAGAARVKNAVEEYLTHKGLQASIIETGCIGLCSSEPLMDIKFPGRQRVSFEHVSDEKVPYILDAIWAGYTDERSVAFQFEQEGNQPWPDVQSINDHPYFSRQKRVVLANCGIINPVDIDEYIARGGYQALNKALTTMSAFDVCDSVEKSGLRGRGGGGFPTGKKWKFAFQTESATKYLVCNADEGDPGAFMDRAVIEGDPHRLIEGMAIAAYAIGAAKAYVYIRAEYPLAIQRLQKALAQAEAYNILGNNILGTEKSFHIVIKKGAGAFVCGEETALLHSIEGKRGMPRPRPPFPAVSGLFGKPTVINNVETLATVPTIIEKGHDWFSAIGTQSSKGTKVFALSGKITKTGLVEIPMGTSIREIIFDIGGGIKDGKHFKAVQMGGPSGGCVTEANLDIPVDYESLLSVGAMMGSGGMVVMDQDTCMVDVAKFFMDFIQRESCGKCIPCREGTRRMLEILDSITKRPQNDRSETLQRFQGVLMLEELAGVIKDTSLCGLGQSAPNPVLSTLRWFRQEYEEHVFDRVCKAGVCTSLRLFNIKVEKCTGCHACVKKCPANAIIGNPHTPHFVIEDKCIGCGNCMEVCKFDAVIIK